MMCLWVGVIKEKFVRCEPPSQRISEPQRSVSRWLFIEHSAEHTLGEWKLCGRHEHFLCLALGPIQKKPERGGQLRLESGLPHFCVGISLTSLSFRFVLGENGENSVFL